MSLSDLKLAETKRKETEYHTIYKQIVDDILKKVNESTSEDQKATIEYNTNQLDICFSVFNNIKKEIENKGYTCSASFSLNIGTTYTFKIVISWKE